MRVRLSRVLGVEWTTHLNTVSRGTAGEARVWEIDRTALQAAVDAWKRMIGNLDDHQLSLDKSADGEDDDEDGEDGEDGEEEDGEDGEGGEVRGSRTRAPCTQPPTPRF